jgi:hypothetical protein
MDKQQSNKTNNKIIVFNGLSLTLSEWANKIGINHSSLLERIDRHGVEKALTTPKGVKLH